MPPREWRIRIEDILEAIQKIEHHVLGTAFEAFCTDQRTVDAVVRNIEIIGEAARYIPSEVAARHSQILWTKMRAMGNAVIHGYAEISLSVVWDTVQHDLPPLAPLLREVLRQER